MAEKVLIIDDDVDTLKLVGLMLQHQGYQISAATSGEQGVEKAKGECPDVILLDVMMPEVDGYEVVRRLRADARTKVTPILMFTAKTQLEDKVTGFEVGADDYLTKPTSPSELQAHIRQLLEHAKDRKEAEAADARRGHTVAVLAARGGLGVSTLAINVAAALRVRSEGDVILAEFTPGQGTIGMDLGMANQKALSSLLAKIPEQITTTAVEAALQRHDSGMRVLPASTNPRDVSLLGQTRQFEALFNVLAALAPHVVFDFGSTLSPWAEKLLPRCRELLIVTEASSNTIAQTRHLIDNLTELEINPAAILVVLNNRVRYEAQLPWTMAQQGLGHPITATLSAAPEQMAESAKRHIPAVIGAPEDVTSQQILELAAGIMVPKGVA